MVKKATKGQKEIYEENQKTLTHYSVACTLGMVVYYSSCLFLSQCSSSDYIFFAVSALIQIGAMLFMKRLSQARFDEKGHVLDAGADLNDPEAFGEYCKDAIILTAVTQLIGLYSTYGFLLLLVFPITAVVKFVTGFLLPWMTAGSENGDEVDERRMKKMDRKREKVVYRR